MMDVSQIIMLYTLNLYTAVCQLYVHKTGRKKKRTKESTERINAFSLWRASHSSNQGFREEVGTWNLTKDKDEWGKMLPQYIAVISFQAIEFLPSPSEAGYHRCTSCRERS